ncbi:hypothetical protein PZB74_12405 [Porifericola rhodea]|uniref:hypothetical protein n=1 Tax=Porifericola rhodea TaxID=930972 RepID=UPI0026664A1E|nr:hypothetical protein [Porifericola rhodea]WKN29768.1 hypothetical protein PZB74_12405 [Porifericola rhodea]
MFKIIFSLLFVFTFSLAQAQRSELDSIVKLHFDKVGSIDKWKSLKTYYLQQSRFFAPIHRSPDERSLGDISSGYKKTYHKNPNFDRTEFYEDDGTLSSTHIFTNKEAKRFIYSHMEERIYPEEVRKAILITRSLHRLGPTLRLLKAYEEKKIKYNGLVDAYGKPCHMFILSDEENPYSNGDFIVYIDTTTNLIHATAITSPFTTKHKLYTDYQEVDGLMIPYKNSSYDKGILFEEYVIQEVKINVKMNDYLFKVW